MKKRNNNKNRYRYHTPRTRLYIISQSQKKTYLDTLLLLCVHLLTLACSAHPHLLCPLCVRTTSTTSAWCCCVCFTAALSLAAALIRVLCPPIAVVSSSIIVWLVTTRAALLSWFSWRPVLRRFLESGNKCYVPPSSFLYGSETPSSLWKKPNTGTSTRVHSSSALWLAVGHHNSQSNDTPHTYLLNQFVQSNNSSTTAVVRIIYYSRIPGSICYDCNWTYQTT